MNESAVLRVTAPIALLLALLVGGCRGEAGPRPLEGASMGGPFTLTSHDGRRVSDAQFAGKYRLVYFGFTFCPDVCPVDLQAIGAGLRGFERSLQEGKPPRESADGIASFLRRTFRFRGFRVEPLPFA